MDDKNIKEFVKNTYAKIAKEKSPVYKSSCQCCNTQDEVSELQLTGRYDDVDGYLPEADLGLGCGLPTVHARIKEGDSVLDLGSGAGNDVFIAAKRVGPSGFVTGIDMTPDMIALAERNLKKYEYTNVRFRLADIERLPLEDNSIDVVISNCVINLAEDKRKVYEEIYRVLKPGAHFCISDIVTRGHLPELLKRSAELYAGCLAGALDMDDLISMVQAVGFENFELQREIQTKLDGNMLRQYLNEEQLNLFNDSLTGIYSLTFSARKPAVSSAV